MRFATGKYSRAVCDRCGLVWKYNELRLEWNGLRTCPDCWEPKHPQLDPPRVKADAEALRNARPAQKEALMVFVGENLPKPPFEYKRLKMVGRVGLVKVVVN